MSSKTKKVVAAPRVHVERVINGRKQVVGLPRPIELEGLRAHFSIKPWTDRNTRSYLENAAFQAKDSLRKVA